jgi:hypothetical protein
MRQMNQTKAVRGDEKALERFRQAVGDWREALEAHSLAPPDAGFGGRLARLAEAADEQARACRAADAAGFDWTPHRAAGSRPPYELQPGTGRRGPAELWQRFDGAVASLSAVATGKDILAVADAYEQLANAAGDLAKAVGREDRARGPRRRARARTA